MDLKLFDELRINQHNTHNYFKSSLRDNKKQPKYKEDQILEFNYKKTKPDKKYVANTLKTNVFDDKYKMSNKLEGKQQYDTKFDSIPFGKKRRSSLNFDHKQASLHTGKKLQSTITKQNPEINSPDKKLPAYERFYNNTEFKPVYISCNHKEKYINVIRSISVEEIDNQTRAFKINMHKKVDRVTSYMDSKDVKKSAFNYSENRTSKNENKITSQNNEAYTEYITNQNKDSKYLSNKSHVIVGKTGFYY